MGDLEDAFLKKNVPGRYSSWAEENDDERISNNDINNDSNDNSDSEDDDYYFQGLPSTTPNSSKAMPPPSNATPRLRPSGNTGVKGVLADYREAQQQEQMRKEEERLENMEAWFGATHPAAAAVSSNDISNNKHENINNGNDYDSDNDDSDFDDGDDEFLKQFRDQRLAQLQNTMTSTTSKLPTFGSMTLTSPDEYVQLVDTIDPQSYLIVHLYEPSIVQCRMLQSTLEKVSTHMNHVKFIQVYALEANPNLDTIILPAILIYKRGELVHNLVRFTEELPPASSSCGGFGVEEVREVLEGLLGVSSTSSKCW